MRFSIMDFNSQLNGLELSTLDNEQIAQAYSVINTYLGDCLLAIHLYGSAIEGGLRAYSDIDLLVTIDKTIDDETRKELMRILLSCSATPGSDPIRRALEVTVINYADIVPWKYPPKREMQFGEWLRHDILDGIFEPAIIDVDLCILLRKIRTRSIPIFGESAANLFDPVPDSDFMTTLQSTLDIWNTQEDWFGDERNIILTIARIWYSAVTGDIGSKEEASSWLIDRLPIAYHNLVLKTRQDYLMGSEHQFVPDTIKMSSFISYAKETITTILRSRTNDL